jgi:hypothetical protein
MRRRRLILTRLAIVLSCFLTLKSQAGRAQETVDSWTRDNYLKVLDMVFSDGCSVLKGAEHARWTVCVRIMPSYPTELEYLLYAEQHYDGTILAHAVRPKTASVYMQLLSLKQAHRTASANELARYIVTQTVSGNDQEFPVLRSVGNEFEKARFSPVLPDELMMDTTRYLFIEQSFSGNRMELVLNGPGSSVVRQPHPLLQWAESFRQVFDKSFK